MYEAPYFEQSRMSKAWSAATNSKTANHTPLEPGLSNASNMSRHSQMTNYTVNQQSAFSNNNRSRPVQPPPLVTSTPYTRQTTAQQQQRFIGNGVATISYHPRNNQRYYPQQHEDARAIWQPPPQQQQRQTVVAFKKVPVFYEDSNNRNKTFRYNEDDYLNMAPVRSTMPPVKRNLLPPPPPPPQNQHHHHSSSGGDSCCSSCCSLSSSSVKANNRHHSDTASFSCSSSCSCCSCNKKPAPILKQSSTAAPLIYQVQGERAGTLTKPVNMRNRAERRRTIAGGISQAEILQAKRYSETTPVYCNAGGDRTSNSRTPVPPKPALTTTSRDSGIGVSAIYAQADCNLNALTITTTPGYAQPSTLNRNKSNLVKTPSGSIQSSHGSNKNVGKTIAVAGDIELSPHATTTIYATTVQTPASMRSSRSSCLVRMEEVRGSSKMPHNASFSSTSSSLAHHNNQTSRTSAGGQVSVASSATRCVPVKQGNSDRFIWVDGSYDEAESPTVIKTAINATLERTKPNPPVSNQQPVKKTPAVTRKHSSFFRTILTTLFGIKPKQHSDADADDPKVNPSKQRRLPSRSASAVFSRGPKQTANNSKQNDNIKKEKLPDPPSPITTIAGTNKSSASFYSQLNVDEEKIASSERNRTWHGLKAYSKKKKADMRSVFGQAKNSSKSNSVAPAPVTTVTTIEDEIKSTYTSLSKDDGSSTLGRQSNVGAMSTLSRPVSRGTSLASTLKSTATSTRGGPLFLVKRRIGSTSNLVTPVPPAAPGTTADPNNPNNNDSAIIANVEQLLAMARVHPTLEYEWIPDDYFI